jgi:hypothetical protein
MSKATKPKPAKGREPHVCRRCRTCTCSIQALEPDEECPAHGWPTRETCYVCGRFMKRPVPAEAVAP